MKTVVRYSDFGAKADGVTNDLPAIKAAHDYANEMGLPVESDPGKTYLLKDLGKEYVEIKTDTLWSGTKFVIDDSYILPDHPARSTPIFQVAPSKSRVKLEGVSSLKAGSTNIGVAPGFPCMVLIYDDEHVNYYRYGLNADKGATVSEFVICDKDGNIDPKTPLVWDYLTVTRMIAIPTEETPITIEGGNFIRLVNRAPNEYTYYHRGIRVTRSNTTIRNIYSRLDAYGETRAPYAGFLNVEYCDNVLIEGGTFHNHVMYFKMSPDNRPILLGSYELNFTYVNRIKCKNCVMPNFYEPDMATMVFKGSKGSNYCKNMELDGCRFSSFDAHKDACNVTIRNTEVEHINCIGSGSILIENTIVHLSRLHHIINLRDDYGSVWNGELHLKNVTVIFPENVKTVGILGGYWYNHNFGFKTAMPRRIVCEDVRTSAGLPLHLYNTSIDPLGDVSQPVLEDGTENKNPYAPVEELVIRSNKYNTVFVINDTPLFKNTKLVIENADN